CFVLASYLSCCACVPHMPRQSHQGARALPWLAYQVDGASVLADNIAGDRQTQSGALANRFGCKEGFENMGHGRVVDPAAVIGDLDFNLLADRGPAADGNVATGRGRI